jgi:hypothetical protein
MDNESLIIGFAIVWGLWIVSKIHRRRGRRGNPSADPPARSAAVKAVEDKAMPRLGNSGSMTANQARALKFNDFVPDKQWSFEEAALILDALVYLRAVCRDIAGDEDGPAPRGVQNGLLRFILTDQDLRDYVRRWGERRREENVEDDEAPKLEPNQQFDRIAAKARDYLVS